MKQRAAPKAKGHTDCVETFAFGKRLVHRFSKRYMQMPGGVCVAQKDCIIKNGKWQSFLSFLFGSDCDILVPQAAEAITMEYADRPQQRDQSLFHASATVGEARSLPRGTSSQCRTKLGEIVQAQSF